MSNIEKFISEAKTHMIKRGWVSIELFNVVGGELYLHGNYYRANKNYKAINSVIVNECKEKLSDITKWTFEHISYLWIKHKMGSKTLTTIYYDVTVHFIIDEFGVPTKVDKG